jgi:hypothetical protein
VFHCLTCPPKCPYQGPFCRVRKFVAPRNGFDPIINRVKKGRPRKPSRGLRFEVTLAPESISLLRRLARRGVYGRSAAEVGGRFIEQALQAFVEQPKYRWEDLAGPDETREEAGSQHTESD